LKLVEKPTFKANMAANELEVPWVIWVLRCYALLIRRPKPFSRLNCGSNANPKMSKQHNIPKKEFQQCM
jgi:hypothetical protein